MTLFWLFYEYYYSIINILYYYGFIFLSLLLFSGEFILIILEPYSCIILTFFVNVTVSLNFTTLCW